MSAPILAGLSETTAPAFSRAATLSSALPFPPEMMAPACPMRRPGGAVRCCSRIRIGQQTQQPGEAGYTYACDECDDRLRVRACLVVLFKVCGSLFLHCTSDLSDENQSYKHAEYVNTHYSPLLGKSLTLCSIILQESLDDIDVLRSREGVTADTDAERLSEPDAGRLVNGLVGQGSGP